jgi:ribosomal protein L7/L12
MSNCPFCDKPVLAGATSCPYCRAPLSGLQSPASDELEQQVRSLLDRGEKIEAIKLYREATAASLLDAKNAVEALERGGPLAEPAAPQEGVAPSQGDWEHEVLKRLEAGQKIDAIRWYREQRGVGLKEAKEAVEALAERAGIATRGGCLSVVLCVLAGAAMLRVCWS